MEFKDIIVFFAVVVMALIFIMALDGTGNLQEDCDRYADDENRATLVIEDVEGTKVCVFESELGR